MVHIGLHQNRGSYAQVYELIRSISPSPIVILGGHEHQVGFEYPVNVSVNFTSPFFEGHLDSNAIFMESENYFKSLTLLDFEIVDEKFTKVNYTLMKTDLKLML